MIRIKNLKNKIIHIGTTAIMPMESEQFPDSIGNLPAVKALETKDIIAVIPVVEAKPTPQEAPVEEAPTEEPAVQPQEVEVSPHVAKARAAKRAAKPAEEAPVENQ